jgi:predicted secreted protein
MITHLIQKYGIIWLSFLMIACNANKGKSVNQESTMRDTLVFTGCQEQLTLKPGAVFEIKLEAVKGTGYQWLLKEPSQFIQQIETDEIIYSPDEENKPGQQSYQVLQFKALAKGKEMIHLEYKRTFEKNIEKSCIVKIVIE